MGRCILEAESAPEKVTPVAETGGALWSPVGRWYPWGAFPGAARLHA